jgi:hypothetical protein
MATERKHYVLTYMNCNSDHISEVAAEYQCKSEDFPARVGYWIDECLIIPNWFNTKRDAKKYIDHIRDQGTRIYYMVQERRSPKGDLRVSSAKIVGTIESDFYPQPEKGYAQEKAGDPMIEVWTMYFYDRGAADQYAENINAIAAEARELIKK